VYQAQPAWHVRQARHAAVLAQLLALRLPVAQALALALPPLCLRALSASLGVGYCPAVGPCTLSDTVFCHASQIIAERHACFGVSALPAWHSCTDLSGCNAS